MSAAADSLVVRPAGPEMLDRAEVVAIDAIGAIVGRAALQRLYGSRGAIELEQAPSTDVALALVDSIEREARARGLGRLELDVGHASPSVVAALRHWRDVSSEPRGSHTYLTWPTNPKVSS
jgi:hypothetical protein